MATYKLSGNKKTGYCVSKIVNSRGDSVTVYDLLESWEEAAAIRDVLNSGVPEDWTSVEKELKKRGYRLNSEGIYTKE